MDTKALKDQYLMTKEDLVIENIELRKYIDQLEAKLSQKPDVFQEGNLMEIIEISKVQAKEESKNKKPIPVGRKRTSNKALDDMMAQYSKYRKVFGEKPASKEVSINLMAILQQNNN